MKKFAYIYESGEHKWAMTARDPDKPGYLIDTNEYLVCNGEDDTLLTDPGGMEIFPAVFSSISTGINPDSIKQIFASHQDPDIISSLALWLEFNPQIKCHISWLWSTFVPHFGGDDHTLIPIPDEGNVIDVNGLALQTVPAHYLHASGNFHLYDPKAKILFSGDVGAALLGSEDNYLVVKDFDRHIAKAAGFHKRWMGSNEAKRQWCERVRNMEIDMMCPQHGAIYQGADVARFIDWFSDLTVGMA